MNVQSKEYGFDQIRTPSAWQNVKRTKKWLCPNYERYMRILKRYVSYISKCVNIFQFEKLKNSAEVGFESYHST